MLSLLPAALEVGCVCICVCARVCVCLCVRARTYARTASTHKSLLVARPWAPQRSGYHRIPSPSSATRLSSPCLYRGAISPPLHPHLPNTRAPRPRARRPAQGLRPRSRSLEAGPKVGRASAGLGALFPGRHFGSLFTFAARRSPATWLSPGR